MLRVDTLANEDALNATRSAVTRMTELLEYADATSRRLGCEPQNVFGHLLFGAARPRIRRRGNSASTTRWTPRGSSAWSRSPPSSDRSSGSRFRTTTTFSSRRMALARDGGFFARLDAAAAACSKEPWRVPAAQRPGGRARGGRGVTRPGEARRGELASAVGGSWALVLLSKATIESLVHRSTSLNIARCPLPRRLAKVPGQPGGLER